MCLNVLNDNFEAIRRGETGHRIPIQFDEGVFIGQKKFDHDDHLNFDRKIRLTGYYQDYTYQLKRLQGSKNLFCETKGKEQKLEVEFSSLQLFGGHYYTSSKVFSSVQFIGGFHIKCPTVKIELDRPVIDFEAFRRQACSTVGVPVVFFHKDIEIFSCGEIVVLEFQILSPDELTSVIQRISKGADLLFDMNIGEYESWFNQIEITEKGE